MKKLKYLLFICCMVVLAACMDDKGNYEYGNYETIKLEGIEERYDKRSGIDKLEINPTLLSKGNYSYMWRVADAADKRDTIGFELNLNYPIYLTMGSYNLALYVTDKDNNGYTEIFQSTLTVGTPYSDGWYVLKDENGMTDMDLFVPTGERITNVMKQQLGSSMQGNAVNLSVNYAFSWRDDEGVMQSRKLIIMPSSDDDTRMLKLEDASLIFDRSKMFYGNENIKRSSGFHYLSSFYAFLTDNGIYYVNGMTPAGAGKFGEALFIEGGMDVAKSSLAGSDGMFVYDNKNNRFIHSNYNGALAEFHDEGKSGAVKPAKPKNLDCDLSIMSYDSDNVYAFMKNENKDESYVFSMEKESFTKGTYYNPINKVDTLTSQHQLPKATVLGRSAKLPYIYFVADKKNVVNLYDCKMGIEDLNILTFPEGEEVTFVRQIYWTQPGDLENHFDYLVVATHKDGKYKLYKYTILGGKPNSDFEPIISEGDGRVADAQFVSSKMGRISFYYYPLN